MSTTLYRKYRPRTFGEIVNQEHVKATIQQELVSNQLPHAFLFCGPRGTGKTTTARVLAKALNCRKRQATESEPCNDCPSCDAMNSASNLNLVEVDAASQTGVDNVRDNIIANARVAVKSDEYKVFIIDEVHMLSTSSFNALLKTLEEPPARVTFILATTEIHKIPETIISRCQRFDFHPVRTPILQAYLADVCKMEKRDVPEAVLAAIVKKSGGYVRDAMSLLGQVLTLPGDITPESASLILPVQQLEHIVAFFDFVSQKQTAEAFKHLHKLEGQGVRLSHFSQELIEFAHKLMLAVVGSHPDIFDDGMAETSRQQIQGIVKRYTPAQSLYTLDVLIKRHSQVKNLDQGVLPLELAVIELTEGPVAAAPAPSMPASVNAAPKPAPASYTPAPAAPAPQSAPAAPTAAPKPTKRPAKAPEPLAAPEPAATSTPKGPLATYAQVQPKWTPILNDISEAQHSLFIILRTAVFRQGQQGEPELAFKYRMHHDHIKRGLAVIVTQAQKHLPNLLIRFTLAIDENLAVTMAGDVEEPKQAETEALGAELSRLADAFGGSVME